MRNRKIMKTVEIEILKMRHYNKKKLVNIRKKGKRIK